MNLDSLAGMAGQSVGIQELAELNKALRSAGNSLAKATVGTPGDVTGFGGTGDFAPLIPQSIQSTLDSATYTEKAISFWKMLQKVPVASTLHESVVVSEYGGMALDPFISEGQVGPTSDGTYERKVVNIKFLAEQREISDVATMVGIVGYNGVSRQGLAQQTIDGTKALMGKLERSLFTADADLNDTHFDGLYKQIGDSSFNDGGCAITSTNNLTDKRGASVTVQDLVEKMYEVHAAPNFGFVNKILVEPRVYAGLVNLATAFGRFDLPKAGRGELIFGTEGLKIAGPGGLVDIESCPLMLPPMNVPTHSGSIGGTTETPAPDALVGSPGALPVGTIVATPAGGLGWTASELEDVDYRVVGVGDTGVTEACATVTVAMSGGTAGQSVQLSINQAGLTNRSTYFRVYRGPAGGELKYMWSFPANALGGANVTHIIDDNRHLPNTAPVYLLQATPDVMYWAQLLDFLRRPLAQVKTTVPFLLMLFGSLHVKIPTKAWIIDNCSLSV